MDNGTIKAMKEYLFGKPKYRDGDGNLKSLYCMFQDEPEWALNRFRNIEEENEKLKELLFEVAISGVELDDDRIDYVTIQIDRWLWDKLQEMRKQKECKQTSI